MLRFFKRSAFLAGLLLCGLLALVMVVYMGWQLKNVLFTNPRYAGEVFADHFPDAQTLESRRWHGLFSDWLDCTYAVVELPEDAPFTVPQSAQLTSDVHWQLQYGGPNWQATPMPVQLERATWTVDACLSYWGDETQSRMKAALDAPGSYFLAPGIGETLFVYSYPQKLAARIRFGD